MIRQDEYYHPTIGKTIAVRTHAEPSTIYVVQPVVEGESPRRELRDSSGGMAASLSKGA
jgi:hypothetical protein